MAKAERSETYDVPAEKFYQAVIDYKHYPDFVDGVESVVVKNATAKGAVVTYTINVIKKISYTLKLTHEENKKVSWVMESGDFLKVNNGCWTIEEAGKGKCKVTYALELEVKGFMPGLGMIEKTLVNTNLPLTMKAFATKAKSL